MHSPPVSRRSSVISRMPGRAVGPGLGLRLGLGLLLVLLLALLSGAAGPASSAEAAGTAAPAVMPRGVWPVDAPHAVLRAFEAPATRYSAGHRGIDVAAVPGQPVYAVLAGVVVFAGTVVDRPLVSISHGGTLLTALEPVTPTVTAGAVVAAGQQIGVLATSSHCVLGCVHLGVRLDGEYVSPLLLLGGIRRAVLLPTHAAPG